MVPFALPRSQSIDSNPGGADDSGSSGDEGNTVSSSLDHPCAGGYPVESYLPAGYVTDGSVDYTPQIQQALDEQHWLLFPCFPLMVNPLTGLRVRSHQLIEFPPLSRLVSGPSSATAYDLFIIWDVDDVTVRGGWITADRDIHIGTTGESGYGVTLRGSTNIYIERMHVEKCWGDGFFFGNSTSGPCDGVKLVDCSADNNRRQGVSITAAKNVQLVRPHLTNTNGTAPQCGIDIEPNNVTDYVQNILILDATTSGNKSFGIAVNLDKLGAASPEVSIAIRGYTSTGDAGGFVGQSRCGNGLKGCVQVSDMATYDSNFEGVRATYWNANGPLLEILRPRIYRPNRAGFTQDFYGAGIEVRRLAGETAAPGQTNGNVRVVEPIVVDDGTPVKMVRAIVSYDEQIALSNITFTDPVRLFGFTFSTASRFSGDVRIADRYDVMRLTKSLTTSQTFNTLAEQAVTYDNAGYTPARTLQWNLGSATNIKTDQIFENKVDGAFLRVQPLAGEQILTLTGAPAAWLQSSRSGARLVLCSAGANVWMVLSAVGQWISNVPGPGTTYSVSIAYNPPSIGAGVTITTAVFAVTGVAFGDTIAAAFDGDLLGAHISAAFVVAADQCQVMISNPGASPVDPASGNLVITVTKKV